jgi:hypothetical protein
MRVEVDSRTIVRVGAGAARRELDTTDVSGERKVGVVEFTDSAHGQASQETRLLGMGQSPFRRFPAGIDPRPAVG